MSSRWKAQLVEIASQLAPLSDAFKDHGFQLFLVGGIVRDSALGELTSPDIDLTTDAPPSAIKKILAPLVSALWDQGERFGTIGGKFGELDLEVTTFRGENYSQDSRKPEVVFGDNIEVDLSRRDFTINAMAVELPSLELVDPFQGMRDLEQRELKTPFDPVVSFSDDPLRLLRAARFAARLNLAVSEAVVAAAIKTRDRLSVVSGERIGDELEKLLLVDDVSSGIDFLVNAEAWKQVFGWVWSDTQVEVVKEAISNLSKPLERRVALFHFAPNIEDSLRALKASNVTVSQTTAISKCLTRLQSEEPSDVIIRELCVKYSKSQLESALLVGQALGLSNIKNHGEIFSKLGECGQLDQLSVPVTGVEIMDRYKLEQGKLVGDLLKFVQGEVIQFGPLDEDDVWRKLDSEIATLGTNP